MLYFSGGNDSIPTEARWPHPLEIGPRVAHARPSPDPSRPRCAGAATVRRVFTHDPLRTVRIRGLAEGHRKRCVPDPSSFTTPARDCSSRGSTGEIFL